MELRITLATLHLLALGIGLGAIWARARALGGAPDAAALGRAFAADNAWGLSALLFISTGLWRWLGGTEKPFEYYLQNHVFLGKLGLLGLVLALEIGPMVTLIRWRRALRRGESPDTRAARGIATVSRIQLALLILMVVAAAAMARGVGLIAR